MRPIRLGPVALLAVASSFSQPQPRLEFEVASIRPSADSRTGQVNVGLHLDGAMVRITYFSLKDYIGLAYKLKPYQVTGPDWIASQRFDVAAKLPAGATQSQMIEMLQTLLADRFKLEFHREKKDLPVYSLVVGKSGSKLKLTPADDDAAEPPRAVNVTATGGRGGTSANLGNGTYYSLENNRFEGKKLTMGSFVDILARILNQPVVDMTALSANYDFTIELTPEDYRAILLRGAIAAGVVLPPEALKALDAGSDESLFSGIERLGLKLDRRKAPVDVLVVDRATKEPTEN